MSWNSVDKEAVVDEFYTQLFAIHEQYKGKFSFGGDMSKPGYKTQRTKTIEYIDAAVAGSADPKGLASRHTGRDVGAADFQKAKAILVAAAKKFGVKDDLGGAVDAVIGSF